MSKAFKDYYEPFKGEAEGIDPSLSREVNYEKFKNASIRYSRIWGKDVELAMVKVALGIFDSETKYLEYRNAYVSYKLEGFIDGAIENNTLFRSKYNSLIKNAAKNGITEVEVKALLESLNIQVKPNPRATTKPTDGGKTDEQSGGQDDKPRTGGTTSTGDKTGDGGTKGTGNSTGTGGTGGSRQSTGAPGSTRRKASITKYFLTGIKIAGSLVILALILIAIYKYTPLFRKESQQAVKGEINANTSTIDLEKAISFLAIQPPEYSKIEEAVKSLKANISQPGAKEGLIKATDIYLQWGDDSPNTEESRSMYQKALECNSAAKGSRTEEIKSKLEDLSR